ncbi:hypothetical protein WME95_05740 [Sorangium sp. So ce327]|uniref:hypothetical protein n=1 Tax=Sorangium sp. So ce327 TaxID=3133301 RepID=UPI003F5F4045
MKRSKFLMCLGIGFASAVSLTSCTERWKSPMKEARHGGRKLSDDEQMGIIARVWGDQPQHPNLAYQALCIIRYESDGWTEVENTNSDGTVDIGLFQINSANWNMCGGKQKLKDPVSNAMCARDIWRMAGEKWTPWRAWTHPHYDGSPPCSVTNPD